MIRLSSLSFSLSLQKLIDYEPSSATRRAKLMTKTRVIGVHNADNHRMCLSSCSLMARVFVYGTLKKGQPNFYRMVDAANGKAELLASACTTQRYPLVIAGEHNIPFLLDLPGQGYRVHGEIYEVDDKMLRFLDDFEDVPAMYQRTRVTLEVKEWAGKTAEGEERPAAGSATEAFLYSTTTYRPDWPSLTRYESYDAHGAHGLRYATRSERD
ncbi:Gamma-glutamylaminecyclotransferase [Liparis tanakae]|uniref:Gamma-glutamylaminecyclotransferase n=1 Tax=Liparis tanakae TaxID=230148 RepID=A0A4Z2GS18_9TELE|nr:Gamma-glutamylaminecyclotransferase [Liparis tanakae]